MKKTDENDDKDISTVNEEDSKYENISTDILIVGAGVAGVCTARRLADKGKKVVLLEKRSEQLRPGYLKIGDEQYKEVEELIKKYPNFQESKEAKREAMFLSKTHDDKHTHIAIKTYLRLMHFDINRQPNITFLNEALNDIDCKSYIASTPSKKIQFKVIIEASGTKRSVINILCQKDKTIPYKSCEYRLIFLHQLFVTYEIEKKHKDMQGIVLRKSKKTSKLSSDELSKIKEQLKNLGWDRSIMPPLRSYRTIKNKNGKLKFQFIVACPASLYDSANHEKKSNMPKLVLDIDGKYQMNPSCLNARSTAQQKII